MDLFAYKVYVDLAKGFFARNKIEILNIQYLQVHFKLFIGIHGVQKSTHL
jgi:hypothetical protein